jgi:hypothetical protein
LAGDIEYNNACNLGSYIAVIDINGNKVGEFEIVESEDEIITQGDKKLKELTTIQKK